MQLSTSRPGSPSVRAFMTRPAIVATVLAALLGGAGGYFAATTMPTEHTATSTILLNPLEGNAFRPSGSGEDLINLTTEAEVMRSDAVVGAVAASLPWVADPTEMLGALTVSVVTNTQILRVAFTDEDPDHAVAAAQSFAQTFLEFRQIRAQASIDEQRTLLGDQITARQEELTSLAGQLAAADPDSSDATLLNARIQTLTSQLTQLNAQVADLAATTLDPGQVVVLATLEPQGLLSLAALLPLVGAAAAAALAVGVAFLRWHRNWLVRHVGDLASLHLRTLAVLPDVPMTLSPWDEGLPTEIQDIRRRVLSYLSGESHHMVLMASAEPASTTLSVPLARAMGRAGLRTILVDTTTRLHLPGGTTPTTGTLSQLIRGRGDVEPTLLEGSDGVLVLPTGGDLDPAALALRGAAVDDAFRQLAARCDLIILHADDADSELGRVMAAAARHVVLEARLHETHAAALRSVVGACYSSGATLLGVVAIDTEVRHGIGSWTLARRAGHAAVPAGTTRSPQPPAAAPEDPAAETQSDDVDAERAEADRADGAAVTEEAREDGPHRGVATTPVPDEDPATDGRPEPDDDRTSTGDAVAVGAGDDRRQMTPSAVPRVSRG